MVLPADTSVFRGTLEFFVRLGIYDVVLPFLLVFTIVFAILEKTRALGTDVVNGVEYTKKNLNAMTAFVIAFFVIASTRLVAIISEFVANTVLLLLLSICFLLLVGSFHTGKKEFTLEKKWRTFFMVFMFIGIILIFLNALGWLDFLLAQLSNFNSVTVSSIVFVIIIVLFIVYVTGGFEKTKKESGDESED